MQVFAKNAGFESNLVDARNFSLGDPKVICRILSDYLYSNKIGSIVRELSANAIDAHRMNGCLDKPFEVHVPGIGKGLFDVNDSDFFIRDFGPGLSEQGIYDLYTSYGASSKREDQFQIGGFGIGSKSPFAYTKAFEVVSWHKGMKAQYICFQDESGSPCVKKLFEEASDEPSGIRVKFTVNDENDCYRFRSECLFQYSWFRPRPFCNINLPEMKPLYENDYGVCWSRDSLSGIIGYMPGGRYSNGEYRALVNNCIYSLEEMYSKKKFLSLGYSAMPFSDCWCILKIDGADVDVSASREELAFTDRTEETVKKTANLFFETACHDLWNGMHNDAAESLFEASWKWRNKSVNVIALSQWAKVNGFESRYWDFSDLNHSLLQYVPLDGEAVWNFLIGGVRGYELSKKQSSSSGFSALTKMTKEVFVKEENCKKIIPNFRHISCNKLFSVANWDPKGRLELYLAGCEDFRLAFVEKGTKFSDIKERTREFAETLGRGCVVHVYASSDEAERKAVVKAYGNPDESRIAVLDKPSKPKERKTAIGNSAEKRNLVRVKVSNLQNDACRYGTHELLFAIRINGKEEWLSLDAINDRLDKNGVLLVLDGTELAGTFPRTFQTLLEFVSKIAGRKSIPLEWIVMNVASYRKYLALGGREAAEDDALKAADRIIKKFGIDPSDFHQWGLAVCMDEMLNFSAINSACDFLSASEGHESAAFVRAFSKWKKVQDLLSRTFSNVDSLAKNLYGYRGRLCGVQTEKAMRECCKKAMKIEEIGNWLEMNPILNLLRNKYSSNGDRERVADIVRRYLVWE